jgi:hypothetical protein
MKRTLKDLFIILAGIFGCYIITWAALLVFIPANKRIDTWEPERSIFSTDTHMVAMEGYRLHATNKKKMFILGSSTSREGFRPKDLANSFPGYEIHNLSIGPSNIDQVQSVLNVILKNTSAENLKDAIFLIGMNFYDFRDNATLWDGKLNRVQQEQVNSHFYKLKKDGVKFILPSFMETSFLSLLRPYLTLKFFKDGFPKRLASFEDALFLNHEFHPSLFYPVNTHPKSSDEAKNSPVNLSAKEILDHQNAWEKNFSKDHQYHLEQWEKMKLLVDQMSQMSAHVIWVEVPVPTWLMKFSFYKEYLTQKIPMKKLIESHGNMRFLEIQELVNDTQFYDSTHPCPDTTPLWAKGVVEKLAKNPFN